MRTAGYQVALLLAAVRALLTAGAAPSAQQQAIRATVHRRQDPEGRLPGYDPEGGDHVRSRRFRPDQTGRNGGGAPARRQGPDRSRLSPLFAPAARNLPRTIQVTAAWDPDLKTFTVFAWTSTSRNIMNPNDLVFTLRPANDQISHKDAKAIWNNIAKSTLKGDDLAKFLKHLDDED